MSSPDDFSQSSSSHAGNGRRGELAALKKLLFAAEETRLREVEERLDRELIDAERLSELLPGAVARGTTRNDQLARALAPTITNSMRESIAKDPQPLVDVIFPIIGPAIRRAIKEAISGLVQTLNRTLEQGLSPKSIGWRLEAWRTGRSFGEVVLLKTLRYRVEHLFLIHRESGLLLQHVSALPEHQIEPELISGMLTAIQDFVRDSFRTSEHGGLRELEVDDRSIWIQAGPSAMLAAVIAGLPPESLHDRLQEVLESIHSQFARELRGFQGDASPLAASRGQLEAALVSESRDEPPSRIRRLFARGVLLALLAAIGFGLWQLGSRWRAQAEVQTNARIRSQLQVPEGVAFSREGQRVTLTGTAPHAWLDRVRREGPYLLPGWVIDDSGVRDQDVSWQRYVEQLRQEPGIVVSLAQVEDQGYRIEGFRDPLAVDPAKVLATMGLDASRVRSRWIPFRSYEESLLGKRVVQQLDPPASVQVEMAEGRIVLRGAASHAWLAQSRLVAASLRDLCEIDFRGVRDVDLARFGELSDQLRAVGFEFARGNSRPTEESKSRVKEVSGIIQAARDAAQALGSGLRVTIAGSADASEKQEGLAIARARWIGYLLVTEGAPNECLVTTIVPREDANASESPNLPTTSIQVRLHVRREGGTP